MRSASGHPAFSNRATCVARGAAPPESRIAAPQQPLNCFCPGVDREHAPTAPEQLDSVLPRAAAEIDGEQSSLVRARSGVEALEREQQRFPRLFARRVVVARPLGTHRRRQTNGDARGRRLGVRPRVRPDIVPMTFTGLRPAKFRPPNRVRTWHHVLPELARILYLFCTLKGAIIPVASPSGEGWEYRRHGFLVSLRRFAGATWCACS